MGEQLLTLSDFNASGLETEALALLTAGAPPTVYAIAPRGTAGSLVDGELNISGAMEPVTAIRFRGSGSGAGGQRITLNDDGNFNQADFWNAGGDGNDLTLWAQTSEGSISFPAAGNIAATGDNFVTFNAPAQHQAFVAGIESGDRFILALTRPAPTPAAASLFDDSVTHAAPGVLIKARVTPSGLGGSNQHVVRGIDAARRIDQQIDPLYLESSQPGYLTTLTRSPRTATRRNPSPPAKCIQISLRTPLTSSSSTATTRPSTTMT